MCEKSVKNFKFFLGICKKQKECGYRWQFWLFYDKMIQDITKRKGKKWIRKWIGKRRSLKK